MEENSLYMMAVLLGKRNAEAPEVQKVFTRFGDCILSRLGVHECTASDGLISLNIRSSDEVITNFENELSSISGVTVKHMLIK